MSTPSKRISSRTRAATRPPAVREPPERGKTYKPTGPILGKVQVPGFLAAPDVYAMVLDGDCLEPEIREGDTAIVSPSASPTAGDYVVLWPVEGRPLMKRLISAPPWKVGPLAPGSTVAGLAHCEMTNPPRQFYVRFDRLKAMHAVMGVMRDGDLVHVAAAVTKPAGARKGGPR